MEWALEYNGTKYPLEACETIGIDEDVAMSDDASEIEDAILKHLQGQTMVIEFDGGIIIQDF
jgi:hypothetical protein